MRSLRERIIHNEDGEEWISIPLLLTMYDAAMIRVVERICENIGSKEKILKILEEELG